MTTCLNTVLNPRSSDCLTSLKSYSSGREPWLLAFKKVVNDNMKILKFSGFRRSVLEEIRRRKRNVEVVHC